LESEIHLYGVDDTEIEFAAVEERQKRAAASIWPNGGLHRAGGANHLRQTGGDGIEGSAGGIGADGC